MVSSSSSKKRPSNPTNKTPSSISTDKSSLLTRLFHNKRTTASASSSIPAHSHVPANTKVSNASSERVAAVGRPKLRRSISTGVTALAERKSVDYANNRVEDGVGKRRVSEAGDVGQRRVSLPATTKQEEEDEGPWEDVEGFGGSGETWERGNRDVDVERGGGGVGMQPVRLGGILTTTVVTQQTSEAGMPSLYGREEYMREWESGRD